MGQLKQYKGVDMIKTLVFRFFCLMASALPACEMESKVEFQEPQPAGKKEEKQFTARFRGEYASLEAGSGLLITDQAVIRTMRETIAVAKAEIDSMPGYRLERGKLHGPELGKPLSFVRRGDTLLVDFEAADTLFVIAPGQVLKYYKGNYLLNTQRDNGGWHTVRLGFNESRQLEIGQITDSLAILALKEVTRVEEVKVDGQVVSYKTNPKKKELKALLRKEGFKTEETFVKISQPRR
jgi:hypothetical protein